MGRILLAIALLTSLTAHGQKRIRELGIVVGVMAPGKSNSITDVPGVKVGHVTLKNPPNQFTGVTAILPHDGNLFQNKVPGAVHIGNAFGKLAGSTQVEELGNIETPIILTNTLSVAAGMDALVDYTLRQPGNENVQSVNALVGETNDGYLNDIRARSVTRENVLQAIRNASDRTEEGCVGAGTGTIAFGFKGGIGTSSRKLPQTLGGYTVGVLVQSNFGGVLEIAGAPVGRELGQHYFSKELKDGADGSCMIVVATDAPLDSRNLKRLAARAMLGLAKTGGISSNGSGDFVIAFSTDPTLRVPFESTSRTQTTTVLLNDAMSPLFMAVIEATEEAILNSMFMANTTTGRDGHKIEALPLEKVMPVMRRYGMVK